MIEGLRNWIINISATVVFITAVEMILPNNKMKKYARFVLGLILITVMLKPVMSLLDKGYNLDNYSTKVMKYFDEKNYGNDYERYREENIKNTINTFKVNLQNECEKTLKDKYPDSSYKVETDVEYNTDKQSLIIKDIKVGVKNRSIERIKKVEVNTKGDTGVNSNVLNDDKSRKIKEYLSKELQISNEAILVYKL